MNTFVGEFTIMLGAFQLNWIYAVLAGGGVTTYLLLRGGKTDVPSSDLGNYRF